MSAVAALREQLETEASAYRHLQKDLGKSVQARNAYMQQMQENQMVMKELEVLPGSLNARPGG
eukprot:CAMPEP_0114264170 /NCGR_PEP_ID=MMETSP0058-20121206/23013_1 /TAXON_ID=36894 /ORGANISM="Pyramimonas parkeae, CCMP726" /LENGTH=62 /DNA_ID=CAMNT_0001380725 /DNA_START=14 /DNA_END=202 /DNA_ORIENTATION=-